MALFGKPNRMPPPPPKPEEPAAPVAPALTKEDLDAAVGGALTAQRAELEAKIAELRGALDESRRTPTVIQAPAAPAPARARVTDEDIDAALASGDTRTAASRLRALVDGEVNALSENFNRQINELTAAGMGSIATVTKEVVLSKLPTYKKYQKEIDAKIATLPAAAQANAEALKFIHDSVVGAHVADIEREAHEAALRGAAEPDNSGAPAPRKTANAPGGSGRGDAKATPSFEEYVGAEGRDILKDKDPRSRVTDGDSLAQSLGYESWAHYMQVEEDTRREAEKLGITLR